MNLSSFDVTNIPIENMNGMFKDCKITKGYARTQKDADELNNTSEKTDGLIFFVR